MELKKIMKQNLFKTKSRIEKKRIFKKKNINHLKLLTFKYNLFNFFLSAENIALNKKVLAELIFTETGVIFSLLQWNLCFYSIINWDS
uniref:ribosomal protein L20 n=1 Tax=Gracilaria cornea TaxID=356490 RepID=UPI001D11E4C7|nr:ribosomal protein L20 [Crassiphycus corneus]UAD89542.1 ribosomal protein L20 [Crassiphycus corneus]